jgi:hypothetical protein
VGVGDRIDKLLDIRRHEDHALLSGLDLMSRTRDAMSIGVEVEGITEDNHK